MDSGPAPTPVVVSRPQEMPGGGAQGMRGRRTAQSMLRKRQRREEDEVAMILARVIPLLDAQVGTEQQIFLQPMSPTVDKRSN